VRAGAPARRTLVVLLRPSHLESPVSETSFGFLLFGSVGAVGAALAVGTLAALWRYHRTGAFPNHEPGEMVERSKLRWMWVRVVLGLGLAAYGVYIVDASGVL
jgi:hypothetical protein